MNESRLIRILVIFAVFATVCVAYVRLFGTQTLDTLEARDLARKAPFVRERPTKLSDLSVSHAVGKKLSYFGYGFEVPWNDMDEGKCRIIGGNKAIIAFGSGNVLSVWSGPPHEFVNGVLSYSKVDRESFRRLYGDEVANSDYSFQRLILETAPDTITPFISKRQAASQFWLLFLKGMSSPSSAASGIFEVSAGEFKGFQFGLPQSSPHGFDVELFSDDGSLDFIFGQKVNGPTTITQADINRILQTLRKVPTVPAALNR